MIDPDAFDWDTSDRHPVRSATLTAAICAALFAVGYLFTH